MSRILRILNGRIPPSVVDCPKTIDRIMAKSHEQVAEVIQNHRYHPRNAESRPQKAQKHRYERRKVREIMRQGEWSGDQA